MVQLRWSVVALMLVAWPAAVAHAACIKVRTATDLDNIRTNLAGNYCLTKDIDANSITNFTPIGDFSTPFTGTLDGRNHVIRNLTINFSFARAGLFGVIGAGAVVRNLGLVNAKVNVSTSVSAATLAGENFGTITRTFATGAVAKSSAVGQIGGLAGRNLGLILQSYASVSVTGGDLVSAGGLAGTANPGEIKLSYATGPVRSGNGANVGGLVGFCFECSINQSYATGPVRGGDDIGNESNVGGLAGFAGQASTITQSFATGSAAGGDASHVGGLVGRAHDLTVAQSYAAGRVSGGVGSSIGGLIGLITATSAVTRSFWDAQTSEQSASAGGTKRTTAQLQAGLPNGFGITRWSITPGASYPFLSASTLNFASPLAITVFGDRVYTFLPISQLDPAQYLTPPAHADEASRATVFTMLARAIGITKNVAELADVAIDRYFWIDATQTTKFGGPVTDHATPGPVTAIANAAPIGDANVVGPLKARKVVAIRGKFQKEGGGTSTHWMLATLFTADGGGEVTALVANDPWTGLQVRIDPATKTVTSPANFPLAGYKVNAFQVITLN